MGHNKLADINKHGFATIDKMEDKRLELEKAKVATLHALESTIVARKDLMSKLGYSFGTDRDLYTALGYPETLNFEDFKGKFKRQDISKTIIEAYPKACWRKRPLITENKRKKTVFEEKWEKFEKKFKVFHYLCRADILSGIGRFGVILMGFKDGKALNLPVSGNSDLIYLRPYDEGSVSINKYVENVKDERYGQPESYKISFNTQMTSGASVGREIEVHWSRVLHIAEGMLENDIYGTPRLEACYNRLMNLELITGGSSEMFWRGGFPGFSFELDADAQIGTQDISSLKDEIEEYMHGMKRYLRTQGMKVNTLALQVASPKDHVDVILAMISGATGIPVRILIGSERGELSSAQDDKAWTDRVIGRRSEFVAPWVLEPFINKMIATGNLPEPKKGYIIEWPDLQVPSDNEIAEIARKKAEAFSRYMQNPGSTEVMPPEFFIRWILGFTEDEYELLKKMDIPNLDKYLKSSIDDLKKVPRVKPPSNKGIV